ncbi:MAG: hypothetical protein H6Q04_1849 [Acidobacteria bacterium]|nr:hypothetical protein [Acidobacteriota bacterium]
MADCALLRESGLHMIRIGRAVVIVQVAGRTDGREPGIDTVFVTRGALHARVSAGQGK